MSDLDDLFIEDPPAAAAPRSRLSRLKSVAAASTENRSAHRAAAPDSKSAPPKAGSSKRSAVAPSESDSDSDAPILPAAASKKSSVPRKPASKPVAAAARSTPAADSGSDSAGGSSDEELAAMARAGESRGARSARRTAWRSPSAKQGGGEGSSSGSDGGGSDGAPSSDDGWGSEDSGSEIPLGKARMRKGGRPAGREPKQRQSKPAKHSVLSESDEEHGGETGMIPGGGEGRIQEREGGVGR